MRLNKHQPSFQPSRRRALPFLSVLLLPLLAALGCSSDSPTAPTQQPEPGPGGGGGATAFNITVTTNPSSVPAGSVAPVVVTITVNRADTGAPPPNGTTLSVATSAGNFGTPGTGPQAANPSLTNGRVQLNLFPPTTPGSATVQAQLQNSFGSSSLVFTEADSFFLQSVSPTSGVPAGGERITISGGGFLAPVRVFVGGQIADVISVSSTQIAVRSPQITLPAGETRSADVAVTNAVGTEDEATDTLPGVFTYRRNGGAFEPQIFSVNPSSGPNEGGTQVTIQGEGFVSPVQVLFGTGSAAAFTGTEAEILSVSPTQILVNTPSATGFGQNNLDSTVSILVRNLNDGAAALRSTAFTYGTSVLITSVSPNVVSYEGGTRVTVFGQGFDEPVAVEAGGVGQAPISVTGTEIIFRAVPVLIEECEPVTASGDDAEGEVSVVNIETGAGATGPNFAYVGPSPPFITNVSPTVVDQGGGDPITLSGGNFASPVQVTINGALASVNSVSPTQVVVSTPPLSGVGFDTEECDDNSDGTAGSRNIPTAANLSFSLVNVETGCSTEGVSVSFTVNPSDTSCQGDAGDPGEEGPTADFSFTVNGQEVSFLNQSTGNPDSFEWEFGDGNVSTATNPVHTYAGPGTYNVTLTATNAVGTDFITQEVTVP